MNNKFKNNIENQKALSREFLLKRGHCCFSGCTNCPYEEIQKIDPNVPMELIANPEDFDNLNFDCDD